jgi:hypothetical protein
MLNHCDAHYSIGVRHVPKYIYDPVERLWARNPALDPTEKGVQEVHEALNSSSLFKNVHAFDKHLIRRSVDKRLAPMGLKVCVCVYVYFYIYIYIHTYVCMYISM